MEEVPLPRWLRHSFRAQEGLGSRAFVAQQARSPSIPSQDAFCPLSRGGPCRDGAPAGINADDVLIQSNGLCAG